MNIKSTLTNRSGQIFEVEYEDINHEDELVNKTIQCVHGYCFCEDKLVIVYAADKGYWTPPGGGVEAGEDAITAIQREIEEETNMKTLHHRYIGCQHIAEPQGIMSQTRSVCIVEPHGPFVSDPDGDITEIRLIDPKEYKQYFDWGEIGDHQMARALELKAIMDAERNK